MKLGEVFLWVTDKALGHENRKKFHIFICEEDGLDGHTFLFISSDHYRHDFKIEQADYEDFLTHDSSISLGRIICYSDEELKRFRIERVGKIKKTHLQKLFHKVQGSETMTGRDIKRVCNALKVIL